MAKFFLTRTATLHLYKIEEYSLQRWGADRTKRYMEDLFCGFARIAKNPEIGNLRKDRSYPFFMAPVEKHFAIYAVTPYGVVIAAILYGRQNIEAIISKHGAVLTDEINKLRKTN